MVDEKLESLLRGAIQNRRSRRQKSTDETMRAVTQEFATAVGHGRYPLVLDEKAAAEMETRVDLWLEIARTIFSESDLAWTATSAEEVKDLIKEELSVDLEELKMRLKGKASTLMKERLNELTKAVSRAHSEVDNRLDQAVYSQDQSRVPLLERLRAPRYSAIAESVKKSRAFLAIESTDDANAAKEAVGAVEQLARLVTGLPTATLGGCIKNLKSSGRVQPPLLKGFEEIWGWASGEDGVRHGTGDVDAASVRLVVAQAEAILAFLLELDTA